MTKLSVNLNKIALLRNSRTLGIPSVTRAARIALEAGAHGITVHPRPDGRHIRPADVGELQDVLREYPAAEFNIEGNPFHAVLDLVLAARPHQCTLVPDEPDAFTSDHGWNLTRDAARLRPVIARLCEAGIRVSLFMDPDATTIPLAAELGAQRVELYTEPYARDALTPAAPGIIATYAAAAGAARAAGLGVNAGHDLNLDNLPPFLAGVPGVLEVSIGHALVADALERGLADTVAAYLRAVGARQAARAAP